MSAGFDAPEACAVGEAAGLESDAWVDAEDGAAAGAGFDSAGFAPPDELVVELLAPATVAGGLGSLLEISVAFRSSKAEGFFGPVLSGAGLPVFLELSFLLVIKPQTSRTSGIPRRPN